MSEEIGVLADRCIDRANDMAGDAELLELQYAAMEAQREERWNEYESEKCDATRARWIRFQDSYDATRRSIKQTRADEQHYRECAAALRATHPAT